jgi:hypothetical protein
MNEAYKRRVQAAKEFAQQSLQSMDMNGKGATITAAKYQARVEAFRQALEWFEEEEQKASR